MVLACCYAIARLKLVLANFYVVLWTLQCGSRMLLLFFTTVYWYFRLLLVVPKVLTSVLGKVTFFKVLHYNDQLHYIITFYGK